MLSMLLAVFTGAIVIADPPASGPTPSVPAAAYVLFEAPDRRVRAPDARMQTLLTQGFRGSTTFAGLLIALNQSDVIVYVESVMTLPKDTLGRLTMVPLRGNARYLRIQIRADLTRRDAIALIGHEMRHALEVAEALDVRDQTGMIRLYERIGHSSGGEHTYDTDAAQNAGRQVRKELAGFL
jgi:hypothetical protein